MPIIQDSPVAVTNSMTVCGNCGVQQRLLLHHVRHRGVFRLLCTTCVLRLHPGSFCPTCFHVYLSPPSNHAVVICSQCNSSSHSHCVGAACNSVPDPYICTLCVDPNSAIFKLETPTEANIEIGLANNEECRVMGKDAANKLLSAAKIASMSMNRAAVAAKAEAERRAKEAAVMRKRAKEMLERVSYLVIKEKLECNSSGSSLRGVGNHVGYSSGGDQNEARKQNNCM